MSEDIHILQERNRQRRVAYNLLELNALYMCEIFLEKYKQDLDAYEKEIEEHSGVSIMTNNRIEWYSVANKTMNVLILLSGKNSWSRKKDLIPVKSLMTALKDVGVTDGEVVSDYLERLERSIKETKKLVYLEGILSSRRFKQDYDFLEKKHFSRERLTHEEEKMYSWYCSISEDGH